MTFLPSEGNFRLWMNSFQQLAGGFIISNGHFLTDELLDG
jgi:hypothetical protein